jgi:hypothetical protein
VVIHYARESSPAIGPWSNIGRWRICAITIGRVVFAAEPETGLALRDNVAPLILLTEYYQVGTCGSPLSGSKALASEQKPYET